MREEETANGKLQHWAPEELLEAFEKGEVAIVDVRTPAEYSFEHIDGAVLAPLHNFKPEQLPSPQGKPMIFHCGSGVRSRKAAEAALASGWGVAGHLEGGFAAWKQARMPTVAIDFATGAPKKVDPRNG